MIIGSKKIFCRNLPSTNTYCFSLLKKGKLMEGTIIHTNYQTAGRGQMGNTWESETDKNLLLSIILYPSLIKAEEQFIISKAVSIGICDFLERYLSNVFIKWPNDIYVNNDKIAGILIENSIIHDEINHTIVGIGLNINQEEFISNIPNPTSLKTLTRMTYDLNEVLSLLCKDLDNRYKQLLYNKISHIDNEYISHLFKYNKWIEFKDSKGIFEGRIQSVSEAGKLRIEDRRGRLYEYGFKEVDFL
jgi:BirA family transcriptional regulator, biotin operon repressor / biotin---[acetyl-CoA-carboxylase] ligase